jgi:cation-transporting P-type ATPase C
MQKFKINLLYQPDIIGLMKYYIHYTPGRIRIETPLIQDNSKKGKEFEAVIKGLKGISDVEIHTITGSAVFHFNEKGINCEQIIGVLEKHNYFYLSEAETVDHLIERITRKACEVAETIASDCIEGGIGA